jgi:hypothetical protein
MDLWSSDTKSQHRHEIEAVRDILIDRARNRRTTTYAYLRRQVPGVNFITEGPILGAISTDTYPERGVFLSAVVVGDVTALPGNGFFELARSLGCVFTDQPTFHHDELNRVFAAYSSDPST